MWPLKTGFTVFYSILSIPQVQCVPDGHPVTMDYNENRVRLSVDKDEKVTSTPMIG